MTGPMISEGSSLGLSAFPENEQPPAELPPPISMRLITEQCLGNSQFALKLLAEFETTVQDRMAAIEKESSLLNLEKVAPIAHSLAGVASILAADPISDIACRLQTAAEDNNLFLATDLIVQMRQETDRIISYLPHFRKLVEQSSAICPQSND